MTVKNKNDGNDTIYVKLMCKLVRILNPLRGQYNDMLYTITCFNHKYDLCISNFKQYGIG